MESYKTIKTYNDSVEANLAKNYLLENGIDVILTDEYTGEIFSNVVKGIKMKVHLDHYVQAEELLKALSLETEFESGDEEIIEILEENGAFQSGHFQLTSGLHSDKYIEKIRIIQNPEQITILCRKLAEKLQDIEADIVVGIAMGGIVLGYEVAKSLSKQFVFSQRNEGKMIIRKGFNIQPGSKAIIIEDIVTTGGSVREVMDFLKRKEIELTAIGLLVDRSGGKVDFGVRTESLLKLNIVSYKPEECPLCERGEALTVPGSSDKVRAR